MRDTSCRAVRVLEAARRIDLMSSQDGVKSPVGPIRCRMSYQDGVKLQTAPWIELETARGASPSTDVEPAPCHEVGIRNVTPRWLTSGGMA